MLVAIGYFFLLSIPFLAYLFTIRTYSYWHRLKIPYLPPKFPLGNMPNFSTNLGVNTAQWYQQIKSRGLKLAGAFVFFKPTLVVVDPDICRLILTKDFPHFVDHGFYMNEKDDPLSAHLFSLTGNRWRNLRVKMTPTFTSGKMKMMFPLFVACSRNFVAKLEEVKGRRVNLKELVARFTTDVICNTAFGVDCNSCKDEDSEYRKMGKDFFSTSFRKSLRNTFSMTFPDLSRFLGLTATDKDIIEYIMGVVKGNLKHREKSGRRNDFFQLLMDMMKTEGGLTVEEIAAQVFVFFVAGFETSSTLMSFALYELARNQEVQDKLREEVVEGFGEDDGKLSYDSLHGMKYLGQVLEETLRMYPPIPLLFRECTNDWQIPDSEAVLKKGVFLFIPTYGMQRDEEFFPNPESFDPERFSEENKGNIRPFTYMPFGEGPRTCIGLRFGLMQARLGLGALIKKFRVTLSDDLQIPLKYDAKSIILTVKDDFYFNLQEIY